MLSNEDLSSWCKRLNLTVRSCEIIADVRSRPPARRVGGGRSNVSGRYPSRKMGATIQFESHRVELPVIYELEHDACVLEYYDQPPSIPLVYESSNGKQLSVVHTPDFFVIRYDAAGWEECKTEQDLESCRRRVRTDTSGLPMVVGNVRPAKSMQNSLVSITPFDHLPRSIGLSSKTFISWRIIFDAMPRPSVQEHAKPWPRKSPDARESP